MTIPLSKTGNAPAPIQRDGRPVSMLQVGVGWESSAGQKKGLAGWAAKRKGLDLDLSAIARDASDTAVGGAYFANLVAFGGAMRHTGDNKTGKGAGYDETVILDLDQMPDDVVRIDITLSSYKGANFSNASECQVGLIDLNGDVNLGTMLLPIEGDKTACLIAKLTRGEDGTWMFQKIGKLGYASTWTEMRDFR